MAQSRQLGIALLLTLAACAPVRRPWPATRDSRVRFDGGRLRVYGAALTHQEAAHNDALKALRLYLTPMAPASQVEAVISQVRPVSSPIGDAEAFASVIDLDAAALQRALGTHYE
jgi:hypothetical protein